MTGKRQGQGQRHTNTRRIFTSTTTLAQLSRRSRNLRETDRTSDINSEETSKAASVLRRAKVHRGLAKTRLRRKKTSCFLMPHRTSRHELPYQPLSWEKPACFHFATQLKVLSGRRNRYIAAYAPPLKINKTSTSNCVCHVNDPEHLALCTFKKPASAMVQYQRSRVRLCLRYSSRRPKTETALNKRQHETDRWSSHKNAFLSISKQQLPTAEKLHAKWEV